jgi:putative heme-binding domain-containing protein
MEEDFKTPPPGRATFDSSCAGCHGLDGRGSDKGPNIAGSARVRHLSDAQVSAIISHGIFGTGMPAFSSLNESQVRELVGYVRALQGQLDARALPGDAARGKQIFVGKGACSTCHMISGEGGFLGPDLSTYGSEMPAGAIRNEIVKSARNPPPGYRSAVVTTRAGERIEGIVRNEDNFSVQLQTPDGTFHFFQKSDVQTLEALSKSPMPADYGQRLSPGELNDLVSYLMAAAPPSDNKKSGTKAASE